MVDLSPAGAQGIVEVSKTLDRAKQLDTQVRTDPQMFAIRQYLDSSNNSNAGTSIPVFSGFRSIAITDSSDDTAYCYLITNRQDDNGGQARIKCIKGVTHNFGETQGQGFLYFPAQSGKWIEVTFFRSGEYRNNTINLANSGGSALFDGGTITTKAPVTVTSVAGVALASNSSRKAGQFFAPATNTGPVYLGNASVTGSAGGFPGQPIYPGQFARVNNTASWYSISDSANQTLWVLEES